MKHRAQNLVNCFLSSDFSEYTGSGLSGFTGTETKLYFNNMAFAYFNDGEIVIYNGSKIPSVIEIINLFPGFTASVKNGKMFINGIEWDGGKTKLSIFNN